MKKIDIIIQARIGSTRLYGKVMKKLEDKIVLDHVIDRVSKAKKIRNVIICTSTMEQDNAIFEHCKKRNILCFRGSEKNVLNRYYETAKFYDSEIIVRLTSDCPLFDPTYIDNMINKYFELNVKYLGPKYYGQHKFPDGFNCEIFSFDVLKEAELNANENEKEHVSTYIIKKYSLHQYEYKLKGKYDNIKLDELHLSLDTPEDYELLKNIFNNVYTKNNDFTIDDVLKYLNDLNVQRCNTE
jgi:spore coat polysaccharide biosynthesis protein SpsF